MKRITIFLITLLQISAICLATESAMAAAGDSFVKGIVYDTASGQPIPYVTVQVVGTSKSALVNQEGRYQLLLPPGQYRLKFSHIGYYSTTTSVNIYDKPVSCDAYLKPTVLIVGGVTVYDKPFDAAQRIILEAIKRKKDILSRIHDYRFDAYSKLVIRQKPKPDSVKILLITETQLTCFWEQPDKYKQVITARKQTSNLPAEGNMVGVGEILNFNRNRIELGRYSVVSPTAGDALDHYNYYLIDSLEIDGRKVYRLDIEPRSDIDPLFEGRISIADSTFDVVEVDVGFNKGISFPFVSNVRYRQQFAQLEREYWMPIEITTSAAVDLKMPGIPRNLVFEHRASLYDYSFDKGNPKGTFSDYDFEVTDNADRFDSTVWYARQTIPLTTEEMRGYHVIDSLQALPTPVGKQLLIAGAMATFVAMGGNYDMFHFNRAEGPYLGYRIDLNRQIPRTEIALKAGYSFDEKHGQFLVGSKYRLWEKRKLDIGADYRQEIVNRPVQPAAWVNPTFDVLTDKHDPYDYFFERGLRLYTSGKLLNHTTLSFSYHDYRQSSVRVNTEFSILAQDKTHRPNPTIADGRLRDLGAEFTYDSRKMIRMKGRDQVSGQFEYSLIQLGAEVSSPRLLSSDFDFRKYYLYAYRRQRSLGLGVTSLTLYAGISERNLPPQRYFQIVSGSGAIAGHASFYTISEQGFVGDRIFSLFVDHDFRQILFRKSGLPLIKKIPFTFSVHGGAFWTDFRDSQLATGFKTAPSPYGELGFGVGNLTPFLSFFNFQIHCSWQLSHYSGNRFTLSWGIGF